MKVEAIIWISADKCDPISLNCAAKQEVNRSSVTVVAGYNFALMRTATRRPGSSFATGALPFAHAVSHNSAMGRRLANGARASNGSDCNAPGSRPTTCRRLGAEARAGKRLNLNRDADRAPARTSAEGAASGPGRLRSPAVNAPLGAPGGAQFPRLVWKRVPGASESRRRAGGTQTRDKLRR